MTNERPERLFSDMRGVRYGEVLAVSAKGSTFEAEVYGTQMLNDTERHVNRGAIFFFDVGSPVYELVNPDGLAYVMQAYCIGIDPTLGPDAPPSLGERLALPDGWTYRSRILDDELVVDTSATIATVLQDELENTYTLPV